MSIILSIETSTKVCSVAIHQAGELLGQMSLHLQKSHSSLLPSIIDQLIENCELTIEDLDAVAISEGPGSYTGLRIGTATAKGLSFSRGIPIIAINSLDTMIEQVDLVNNPDALFCPMIDARRMEVYCKLIYGSEEIVWETAPLVVDEGTFETYRDRRIFLFGNGSGKFRDLLSADHFRFIQGIYPGASFMGRLSFAKFEKSDFEDLAYFEPEYLKEYRTNPSSQKFKV